MKYCVAGFGVMFALLSTGCMPDHLADLDGKTTIASLDKSPDERLTLRDQSGASFDLQSSAVGVKLEINRIFDSTLTVSDMGKSAVFVLPKSVLNKEGSSVFIPSAISKQPVELVVTESAKVLSRWLHCRHVSSPNYMITTDSNGNTSTMYIGDDEYYYEDNVGKVEHDLNAEVYAEGASRRGMPSSLRKATLSATIFTENEVLSTRTITEAEYVSRTGSRR